MYGKERIYPSWDEINKFDIPLNEGEKNLALFFDENLPEYWKIYIRPFLNGSYPDIVLLNPEGGLMIYKVINDNNSNFSPPKTKKQLDYYRNKIIQELVPDMGEKMDENSKIFVIIKTGIYIHNMNGSKARELYHEYPYLNVIGYDDLNDYSLYKVVPGVDFRKSKFMDEKWANDLQTWMNPPLHQDKRTGLKLNDEQNLRVEPKPGHRRLRGVAGGGKTLIIAHRAAKIAEKGLRVLVITYNRTLWYYIKNLVDQTPYNFSWSNITFRHFHGFCMDILNELMINSPDIEEIEKTVYEAISTNSIDKYKFDAILIDEGQDYKWEWYDLLSNFLTERNELFFVCDKKQNIYDRELSWVDNMGESKGKVQFKGVWPELKEVYRLPNKIAEIANQFSEEFQLDQSVQMDPQSHLIKGDDGFFLWENIEIDDWLSNLENSYEKINDLGISNQSEIVILLPKNRMGVEAVELFEAKGIDTDHVFIINSDRKWRNKKLFRTESQLLKISTIHKFKGWEAQNVIMLIPEEWVEDENLDAIVYTAMTRTMKNLIVLNCNERYFDFGESVTISDNDELKEEEITDFDEFEIEQWIETLPYPLASILWASISSYIYEHKVKYLLQFFEAFAEFNFNLLLSGLSSDELFFKMKVKGCLEKEKEFNEEWFEKPSFGVWNHLTYCLSNIIRKELKHNRSTCLKLFGKPDKKLLESLTSYELNNIFKKASRYRNNWEGHGPRVSEKEYEERFNELYNMVIQIHEILGDSFKNTFLVAPVQSILKEGVQKYTVKKLMTTRPPFRSLEIESDVIMDSSRIHMINKNKKSPLKILPLILVIDDICYYYNGKDPYKNQFRYSSYHYTKEPEILIPYEKLNDLLSLIN